MFIKHKIQVKQLLPGVQLLNLKTNGFPVSVASAWFRAGARFDNKQGMAHLFEHLFMKRSKLFSDPIQRLEFLESSGIYFNAHTDYEIAHYYHIQTSAQFLKSFSILLNSLEHPIFQAKDLAEEKGVVLAEAQDKHDDPWDYMWQLNNMALWPKTGFANDFFGNKKSIQSVEIEDIEKFYQDFYQTNEMTLVTLSNCDINQIASLAKNILSSTKRSAKILLDKPKISPEKFLLDKRNNKQIVVSIAYRVPAREFILVDFIRQYFANQWSSKFNKSLRLQNKLSYWVYGDYAYFSDVSHIRFTFSCDVKDFHQCLQLLEEDISAAKVLQKLEKDLFIFKKAFLASLQRQMVDPYELIWWYGRQAATQDKVIDLKTCAKMIKNITAKEIIVLLKKYFVPENRAIAVIGNIKKDFLKNV
jgi:predicted Zn-dependent peptidase